jgi:hypothetical protein
MAEGVQTYRMLIRAIHKNIGSQSGSRLWINHVREEFKRNRPSVTVEDQTELLQHARDYAFLINGVRYQKVSSLIVCSSPAEPKNELL